MIEKIEVYVRNEEVVTGQAVIGRPLAGHWCTAKETLKTQKVMPEADRLALEMAEEFAREKGLHLEVYDTSSFKGKLKASLKGVKTTPTIIIGNQKIEGKHASGSLRNKLKSYLSE